MCMQKGDFIKIEFVGRLESGEIFDWTDEALAKKKNIYNPDARYKPMPIILGSGMIIKGLDEELMKMAVGDEKEISIEPENGFGKRDPNLVQVLPEKRFGDKKPLP